MKGLNIGGLKLKLPIIQGGMGVCVSLANLAAAVSNQGALGVISAVGIGMLEKNYRKHFKESNLIALQKETSNWESSNSTVTTGSPNSVRII